jgi:hypothetical protein
VADKTYLVRFKLPELRCEPVIAELAEIYGEHLVFVNSAGDPIALLLEIVESWSEVK